MKCRLETNSCDRVIRRFQSQENRLSRIHLCGRCLRLGKPKVRLVDNVIGVCVAREMIKPILVRQRDEWGEGHWGTGEGYGQLNESEASQPISVLCHIPLGGIT